MADMVWQLVSDVLITVHGRDDPEDDRWQEYLEFARGHRDAMGRALVYSAGGKPSTQQRAALAALEKEIDSKVQTAFLLGNRAQALVVTALSWLSSRRLRSYTLNEFEPAAHWLGLSAAEKIVVRQRLELLKKQVEL